MRRRHGFDIGAEQGPVRREFFHGCRVSALGRREDAPAADKQCGKAASGPAMFGAGHRMRGHKCTPPGQMRSHSRTTAPLTEPTSETIAPGDRCAPISARPRRKRRPGRRNDEVRAGDRGGVAFNHLIGEAKFGDAAARLRRIAQLPRSRALRFVHAPPARSRSRSDRCRSARGG